MSSVPPHQVCFRCGTSLDARAKFCPDCGGKLSQPQPTSQVRPSQPTVQSPNRPSTPLWADKGFVVCVLAGVATLALLLGIALALQLRFGQVVTTVTARYSLSPDKLTIENRGGAPVMVGALIRGDEAVRSYAIRPYVFTLASGGSKTISLHNGIVHISSVSMGLLDADSMKPTGVTPQLIKSDDPSLQAISPLDPQKWEQAVEDFAGNLGNAER